MSASRKLIEAWQGAGILDQFKADYPTLPRSAVLKKYIKHLPDYTPQHRHWQVLIEIAGEVGIKRGAYLTHVPEADLSKLSLEHGKAVKDADAPLPPRLTDNQQFQQDLERERLRAEAGRATRLYHETVKRASFEDKLLGMFKETIQALKPIAAPPIKPPKAKTSSPHAMGALLSDLHIGEVVDPLQTGGLGQYNMALFNRRSGLWAEKILELVDLRRSRLYIPTLNIPWLGDVVSGDIHEELSRTNEVNVIGQMAEGAYVMANRIAQLAPHFERIVMEGYPGNHGRMTKKPPSKEQYVNWDYIAYQMIAMFLKGHKNVSFEIGKAFYGTFEMEGYKFLGLHGDSIRGWAGLPWYGIERAVLKLRQLLDLKRERFDYVVLAHFHDPVDTMRFLVNGDWKGSDEYSISKLHTGGQPTQTVFYVHKAFGIVAREWVYLEGADNQKRLELPRALPDVWAKAEI